MKTTVRDLLQAAHEAGRREGAFGGDLPDYTIEKPRNPDHGHLSANLALKMARVEKKPPAAIAQTLRRFLTADSDVVARVDIAGPGFLNFTFTDAAWQRVLADLLSRADLLAPVKVNAPESINIEFVSCNPTGPLNVVNARAAALGDSLRRILRALGHEVVGEYYINDAGRQADLFGASVRAHLLTLTGRPTDVPEEGYRGEYVRDLARDLLDQRGPSLADEPLEVIRDAAIDAMVDQARAVLARFGVYFERWSSERSLHDAGAVAATLEQLRAAGLTYRDESDEGGGAEFVRTTALGDEKDRVLVRSNGRPTYFLADLAYHLDKKSRGHDRLIDIWGPDHHGHIHRMTVCLEALGLPQDRFEVLIAQQVNLLEGGRALAMSKRRGNLYELEALLRATGVDAARWFFVNRRFDSHLDFDVALAVEQSANNPVYYVQYAHARIAGVFETYRERGGTPPSGQPSTGELEPLTQPEERALIEQLSAYPDVVAGAGRSREPHRVAAYLHDLAAGLQHYYHQHRFLTDDPAVTRARLWLLAGLRRVLAEGLSLIGVSAPDRM